MWNEFLKSNRGSFFKVCWLYAECYMYRKVRSFFESSELLKEYDYFAKQKKNALTCCTDALKEVARTARNFTKNAESFRKLLKVNFYIKDVVVPWLTYMIYTLL